MKEGHTMSIGYACILFGVAGCSFKACKLSNADEDNLRILAKNNLVILDRIIEYNIENNIKLFRISSDIIPFGSHPINQLSWRIEHKDLLDKIGGKIKEYRMRVSMHPGQYTVLNSPDPSVVNNAIRDLNYHARFLNALDTDASNKIVLHIGGVYGDKEKSIERFIENFYTLKEDVKRRLVIENDEKSYNISDVLKIGNHINIPVIFDSLHHIINPPSQSLSQYEWIKLAQATWKEEDGRQKIHYSQQAPEGKPGAHSKTIGIMEFMDFYNNLDGDLDIMLEVKDKNLSAIKCIICTADHLQAHLLEREWAKYKYLILSHSQSCYLEIREMLKNKNYLSAQNFYEKIEEGINSEPSKGSYINAAQHIWGYFKNYAEAKEKERFIKLLQKYNEGESEITPIKTFLLKLAIKYREEYLIQSYYFT